MTTNKTTSSDTFSPRLKIPRIVPIGKESRTDEQKEMLSRRPEYNIYTTLAHHTKLYNRWTDLGQYLLRRSTLPVRDREIVMLRMGWLCQSEYEWSQHARIAKTDAGLANKDIRRIAEGPDAKGWTNWDRTLLTMADELRYEAMISDATWKVLRETYSEIETMDVLFTAAQYQLVSMALNSAGIQLDPELEDRLPVDLPLPEVVSYPSSPRLKVPRIPPLPEEQWTEVQRQMITPQIYDGKVLHIYGTLFRHPDLYAPRLSFGSFLQRHSSLPPKTRELLIMRTAWLIKAEYEWSHHVSFAKAAGFSDEDILRMSRGPEERNWSREHQAVLRAADELRREAFIHDATWQTLTEFYDIQQILEIIFTVGGYTMTGLAINNFGIQVEEGYPRFTILSN